MNNKHAELNTVVKVALLLGFAAFYIVTLFNGSVSLYVHPRMIPFMIFAAAVMVIIAVVYFVSHVNPGTKKDGLRPLLLFIAALLMAWAFPAQTFDTDSGTAGAPQLSAAAGLDAAAAADNTEQADIVAAQAADASVNDEPSASDTAEESKTAASVDDAVSSTLIFEADNFYENLYNIYADMDAFIGREVELTGFVYRDDALYDDEFVTARLLMVCCAADMQTVGLLCRWPDAGELESDTWVTVTGTLTKTALDGESIPVIEATSVEETSAPDIVYIYPF